ncbi:MAG: molybdopterin molybdotransferase MoeA [Phyllobacteriaceae bacterium]|nr:molybdopterin molybdotransferase MoeA [Phyllobacteriaceae bacterium]
MALLPVADALARILDGVVPLPSESIAIGAAVGRVLTDPVIARRDQPPFAASAMDGYAVRHEDVATLPASLVVAGVSAAGRTYRKALKPGQAIRILTGAPVPEGADTVVIQENTRRNGDRLTVEHATAKGRNIRRQGLDFHKDDVLLDALQRLRPRDIGLAAAGNAAKLRVRRKPHVILFTTGDELVLPGERPRPDQIISSNSNAIAAMAESLGARVSNLGIVRDTLAATKAAVRRGLKGDVLLSTGGASVGDHDYVREDFKACGIKIGFWKIAMRPGKPFMYGRKGKVHVMGLPGNPVSALITARLFLRPLLDALQGLTTDSRPVTARLGVAMPANDERQDYIRATLEVADDGRRTVTPFSLQDSSMQRTLQMAQALIIRPALAPAAAAGDSVPILLLDF